MEDVLETEYMSLCCDVFQKNRNDEANEQLLAALKAEKDELEATLNREGLQTVQLKEEITEADGRNVELTKTCLLCYLHVAFPYGFVVLSVLLSMHSLSIWVLLLNNIL